MLKEDLKMTEATLQALEGLRDLTTFKWMGHAPYRLFCILDGSGRYGNANHCRLEPEDYVHVFPD